MSPKEKAERIIGQFVALTPNTSLSFHKQCALIVAEECRIEAQKQYVATGMGAAREKFWYEVIQEIENIHPIKE